MRDLRINQRETDGVVILDLNGPVVIGLQHASLRERLRHLLLTEQSRIVLNLRDAGKIDSTGLGTLVSALVNTRKAGGGLALCNLNASHLDLLVLTRLVTAFGVFADEHDAIESLFPGRATQSYDILTFVRRQDETEISEFAGRDAEFAHHRI